MKTLLFHPDVQVNKAAWDIDNTALIYAIMDFKKRCDFAPCYGSLDNESDEYLDVVNHLLRCPDTDVFYQNNNFQTADQIAINRNLSNITKAFHNRGYLISTGHTYHTSLRNG